MAETLQELKKFSDDELIERHNRAVKNTEFLGDFYLRVLNWRFQERHTKQIQCLTWAIAGMTAIVTIATIINVVYFICCA